MRAWEITKKDLRLLARDRRTLAVLVALPMIFIAILGGTTGKLLGWKEGNQLLRISVVDESRSELSARLIKGLAANPGLTLDVVSGRSAARKKIAEGGATVGMYIGPAFESRVEELRLGDLLNPARGKLRDGLAFLDITFDYQPSFQGTGAIVSQLVVIPTLRVITPIIAGKNPFTANILKRTEESTGNNADEPSGQPAAVPGNSKNDIIYRQVVPSYTVMFVFFLVNIMARSFISEREMGTLRRLRIAPIGFGSLLLGKTVPFFAISLVQSVLLFLFGRLLFGMSWGEQPWLLIPIIVCTSMAATAMGLLVATLVRTDQQVSAYANFIVITMAGVSGCFMPRDWLPPVMQTLSLATPHAWALMAYHATLSTDAVDCAAVYRSCAMLVGFAALFFGLGWWRFRTMD